MFRGSTRGYKYIFVVVQSGAFLKKPEVAGFESPQKTEIDSTYTIHLQPLSLSSYAGSFSIEEPSEVCQNIFILSIDQVPDKVL